MTRDQLLRLLAGQPLVVSVQASDRSPVDDSDTLLKLAQASVAQGVRLLRLEGAERVHRIRRETGVPAIGLIKRIYPGSDVYITPTSAEVDYLLATGCEVIALDATLRRRPANQSFGALVKRIQKGGVLAMADCDCLESALAAIEAGADIIGTTLAGYTDELPPGPGPNLELLREIVKRTKTPVLAEGRFGQKWQVEASLRIGAAGVVVGGTINDPVKTTRAMMPFPRPDGDIGALDIGGTWMRFAIFSPTWDLLEVTREPLHRDREKRNEWIANIVTESDVVGCGVSTGGTVDPATGEVWEAKEIIPDYVGTVFELGVPTTALNDGLAAAWGHACLPEFAGRRVATLALGTGVGCGFVADGRIWMGPRGEYPRINDLRVGDRSFEDLLGGAALTPKPNAEQRSLALMALRGAVEIIRSTMFPDEIVVCGSVGLSGWMQRDLADLGLRTSPFGPDAGLFGAAALVLYPPAR